MTPRVGEILRKLTGAEFRSDVQIADYWSERNLDLLKDYIFTSQAPVGKKSSVDLLRTFCEVFTPSVTENRFVVIATYGHGKSHFALTLANFFGRQNGSDESAVVLRAIRHAIPDQDLGPYGFIEDFKQQHRPFLILILRGDEPNDLPTKVHKALKLALDQDSGEPGGSELPFWFNGAEEYLVKVDREHRGEADKWLAKHNLDLDSLLTKVRDRQASVRDTCVALAYELTGLRPQFDEGVSLAEVVKWVVDNKCGSGKPYAGLLILFDEFSTFVDSYSRSSLPGTHLQDLLNGVANARERAAFIAFAQHDPYEVARRATQGPAFDNIKKELDRLPGSRRYQMHSSLEEVLESYLRKRDEFWLDLLKNNEAFKTGLNDATIETLKAFLGRYSQELKWDVDRFHRLVTEGCYPLHPLATSLLCSIELQATVNPRSVLGFVQETVNQMTDDPVGTEAGPIWVRAVSLVDYFKGMLGEDNWRLYKGALSKLIQPDEPQPIEILKAMMLVLAGGVSTEKMGYTKAIAELSGLSVAAADSTLVQLTERSIIRKDAVTGNYTIAPNDWGKKGESIARGKIEQLRIDAVTLEPLIVDLERCGLERLPLSVGWGHPDEWYAQQILVDKSMFTQQYLQGVLRRHTRWTLTGGAKDKGRVLLVWLLAYNETEVAWYRNQISEMIRSVVGESAAPFVVMRPNAPSSTLIERLKKYVALKQFTPSERAEAETGWYMETLSQAEKHLKAALDNYHGSECAPEVPVGFRARVESALANNLNDVLFEVVQMAYPHGPTWFNQYKLGQPTLVNAVSQVYSRLIQHSKIDQNFFEGKSVAKDIVFRYLINDWQVMDKSGRAAQPTQGSRVYAGWEALDRFFPVGHPSGNAGRILEDLLNPPFGYDWNTLALLFTMWYAYRRHDLELIGDWQPWGPQLKPRDLIEKVSRTSIRRREDPTGEVRQLVQDIRSGRQRPQSEAQTQLRTLKEFLMREGLDTTLKSSVSDALSRLEEGLKYAEEYDKQATQIRLDAGRHSLNEMLSCLPRVRTLPTLSLVGAEMPAPDQIATEVRQRVDVYVDGFCAKFGRLKQLEDYTNHIGQLKQASKYLDAAGLSSAVEKVRAAIEALERDKGDIESKQQREAQRRQQETLINSLSPHGPITSLRENLTKIDEMTPQPGVEQPRMQKRNAIAQELERLEAFAKSFTGSIDKATDGQSVLQLRDEALRLQNRYDDATTRSLVEAGIGRCDVLVGFFGDIERLRNNTRAHPQDFARDTEMIRLKIDGTSESLSDAQRAAAESVIQALNNDLTSERQSTVHLLHSLRQELGRGVSPEKIKTELDRLSLAWEFLEQDGVIALEELRSEVNLRLDQARIAREEEARKQAERKHQMSVIESLSVRVPMCDLRGGLATLDQLAPQPEVEPLWQKKRSDIVTELDRLMGLPPRLNSTLDQATNRRSVDSCRTEALQSRSLCDEIETKKAIDDLLARCRAIDEHLGDVENVRTRARTCPDEFDRDITALRQAIDTSSMHLSEEQRGVTEDAIVDLESALSAKQQDSRNRLAQVKQGLERGQSASKMQRELESADWSFLPLDARNTLTELKGQVQGRIDADELQQVEQHFRNIRDAQLRRKCLEALQRLVEEGV